MDMTRNGPDRTLPIDPVRILRARQQVYSASQALIGRLKHATFSIELGAGICHRDTPATHSQRIAIDGS